MCVFFDWRMGGFYGIGNYPRYFLWYFFVDVLGCTRLGCNRMSWDVFWDVTGCHGISHQS